MICRTCSFLGKDPALPVRGRSKRPALCVPIKSLLILPCRVLSVAALTLQTQTATCAASTMPAMSTGSSPPHSSCWMSFSWAMLLLAPPSGECALLWDVPPSARSHFPGSLLQYRAALCVLWLACHCTDPSQDAHGSAQVVKCTHASAIKDWSLSHPSSGSQELAMPAGSSWLMLP